MRELVLRHTNTHAHTQLLLGWVIKMIQILGMSLRIVIMSNVAITRRSSLQHFTGKTGSTPLCSTVCVCVSVCVLVHECKTLGVKTFLESEDILASPHFWTDF